MQSIYKKLTAQDIGQVPFNANKQYTIHSSSFGAQSITNWESSDNYTWSSASIESFSSGAKDGVYPSLDTEYSLKYFQLEHLFYKDFKLSLNEKLGHVHYLKHKRELYNQVRTISIPNGLCGSRIKPLTFKIKGNTDIIDDSYGNLYVSSSILSDYNTDIRTNILKIGPEKGFKNYDLNTMNDEFEAGLFYRRGKKRLHKISSYTKDNVIDDSYFFNLLNYKNVTFSSKTLRGGEFSGINFNGTDSGIYIENDEKFHFNPSDDFTISLWADVKEPTVGQLAFTMNAVSASNTNNEDLTLISSNGTTKTYRSSAATNGSVISTGIIAFGGKIENAVIKATNIVSAINGTNGHNGELIANQANGFVTIKQKDSPSTIGTIGNTSTTVTSQFNVLVAGSVASNFTQGTDVDSYLVSKSTTQTIIPAITSNRNVPVNTQITGALQTKDVPSSPQFPFEIYAFNDWLYFRRSDGDSIKTISSSFTAGTLQHITCRVSSSQMEMFIDGVGSGTSGSENFKRDTQNNANLYIGNKGETEKYLTGSLSQINIYDEALTNTQILNHYSSSNGSPYVGNIFYESGLATITHPNYHSALNITDLNFQGSHLIYENEYQCTIEEHEFNHTLNPSTRRNKNTNSQELANFATGSNFKPYITTVGLYNEAGELLVVGKLGQPTRMSDETDTTLVIRWDK
ncbi:LamG domain-containing protein [Akkermansiaceae bacterium]|nr:LamG domain-containing protein [Akkermansiaceae bacterium]